MDASPAIVRRAVIDVGTNSVKVLVADIAEAAVTPVWETSEQTRLGRGFYETHLLQREPIDSTARAVARFAVAARERGACSVRVIATSAARDAKNPDDLCRAIRETGGLETEVISGEQEASWAFAGVGTDPSLRNRRLLILDVGGGSTELILGSGGRIEFQDSFQLGSVRLLERYRPGDHPSPAELEGVRNGVATFLREKVAPGLPPLKKAGNEAALVIGVGGTTAILALIALGRDAFDRSLIEQIRFNRAEFRALNERLWSLSLAERQRLPGLPPERADVILTGAAIYEGVLEVFQLGELGVSTRGLRFAAVREGPAVPPPGQPR